MKIFELLGLDPWVFLWHMITFAALVAGAVFLVYFAMRNMMNRQNKELSDIVDENKKLTGEAEESRLKREAMEAEAKEEAMRIVQEASKTAAQKTDEAIEQAQVKANGIVDAARKEAVSERERLKDDYRRTVTDMSMEIAEKILARECSQKDNQKIIDECIKELMN